MKFHIFRFILGVLVLTLSACGLTAKQPLAPTRQDHIAELSENGTINIRAQGISIDELSISIENLYGGIVVVEIPMGTYFVPQNSKAQDMVVTKSQEVTLFPGESQDLIMNVACANINRDIPTTNDAFAVQKSDSEDLYQLLRFLEAENAYYDIKQAAIWIVTDNADYEDLGTLVGESSGPPGFSNFRIIGVTEVAKAMQIVDEAGIDITSRRIWNDREFIADRAMNKFFSEWIREREQQGRLDLGQGQNEGNESIQDAINAAQDGDVIIIPPGTYKENIDFIGKNITLRSTDPDDPNVVAATIIDGGGSGSVVTFQNGETNEARLEGFTITNGNSSIGGGIIVGNNSSPTIKGNIISSNQAQDGGGIAVAESSGPTIDSNTITGNRAVNGGGIAVRNGAEPVITGNTIVENQADDRGGGILILYDSFAEIVINIIEDNQANGGGGISVQDSLVDITENTINGNHAENGGGIFVENGSSSIIQWNTITTNNAEQKGGAITVVDNSKPLIEHNTIQGNQALTGGGITVLGNSSPTIKANTISENQASTGGGIFVFADSTIVLKDPDNNFLYDNQPDDIYYEPE